MNAKYKMIRTYVNVFLGIVKINMGYSRFPFLVELLVTKNCNLRCKYCYVDFQEIKDIDEAPLDTWLHLVDELSIAGTKWVRIIGGEPLLREDLLQIVRYIKRKHIMVDIVTNGWFVKNQIEALKEAHAVCVSLDGPQDVTDANRGNGTYKKVLEALDCLKANKVRVRLHAVLTNENFKNVLHVREIAKQFGCSFNVSDFIVVGKNENKENYQKIYLTPEEQHKKEFLRIYEEAREKYPELVHTSHKAIQAYLNWPFPNKQTITKQDLLNLSNSNTIPACLRGRYACSINPDGRTFICPSKWGKGVSAFDVGFKEAWRHIGTLLDCYACRTLGDFNMSLSVHLSPASFLRMLKVYIGRQ
jgi:MoaA/NifB/PqqE/SkfB family radical SAM enzyme